MPVFSRLSKTKNIDIYDSHTELDHVPTFGGEQDERMNGSKSRKMSAENVHSEDGNLIEDNPFELAKDLN